MHNFHSFRVILKYSCSNTYITLKGVPFILIGYVHQDISYFPKVLDDNPFYLWNSSRDMMPRLDTYFSVHGQIFSLQSSTYSSPQSMFYTIPAASGHHVLVAMECGPMNELECTIFVHIN